MEIIYTRWLKSCGAKVEVSHLSVVSLVCITTTTTTRNLRSTSIALGNDMVW